jgi:hypothetical protein
MSFLEVYKELMHCFVVFPFFLKYFTNAEYTTYDQYYTLCVEIHTDDIQ